MSSSTADDGMELPDWPDPDPDHVLTSRQQKILQVITDFALRRRYAPTLHEIGEATGLASRSSVSYQLSVLQRKGYLRRIAGRPRTIELRLPGQPTVRLEVEDLAGAVDIPPRTRPAFPFRSTARSPRVLQTWPSKISGTSGNCPRNSSATGHCSASGSAAIP
jgi:SOS-response transcriptional repressor LexA